MDEYLRIARLLEEEKITPEEAEKLLEALEEGPDLAPREGDASWSDGAGVLRIHLFRGNVHVVTDPGVAEPQLEEGSSPALRLERRGEGWRLSERREGQGLSGLLAFLNQPPMRRVELRIPAGYDLKVKLGQGSLTTAGELGRVVGELGQGNAVLEVAAGVSLELGQGNAELGLRLKQGEHRIECGMGNVKLRILPGSDVTVDVRTGMGKVQIEGSVHKHEVGARGEVVVGGGEARLRVESGMGNVEVRLP